MRPNPPGSALIGPTLIGPALFCAGLAAATVMDALAKLEAGRRPVAELLLWRGFGALPFLLLFAVLGGGGVASLRPRAWGFVLGRGAAVGAGTWLFFWSLKGLSLTAAYIVAFTAPLMLIGLAAAAGERVGARTWLAVAAGFAGVLLAAAPGGTDLAENWAENLAGAASLPGLAALGATFLYALGLFLVRHGGGAAETPGALVLGNLLATGVLGLLLSAFMGGPNFGALSVTLPLLGVAALAGLSQILVTLAFAAAPAARLAPFEYITLPLGAAVGFLAWGDSPGPNVLAGALVVACSVGWLARLRAS